MVKRMKRRQYQRRKYAAAPSASSASAASDSSWQRSNLGYKERFVDDFAFNNIRVRQFPCRTVFERAVCEAFESSSGYANTHNHLSTTIGTSCYEEDDGIIYADPVPDTAFTVWESSILLGMYVSRKDVWKRLIGTKILRSSRPVVSLELGAGAGVSSLLLASSEVISESKCDYQVVMTDLPSTINFTRLNVHTNIDAIASNAVILTQPLRWGCLQDMSSLPRETCRPDVLLGADLLYTIDKSVISALADTVILLAGRVAVFAVCKQHRPESIEFFLSLVQEAFEIRNIPASTVHDELHAIDEDFAIIELWRKKRLRK